VRTDASWRGMPSGLRSRVNALPWGRRCFPLSLRAFIFLHWGQSIFSNPIYRELGESERELQREFTTLANPGPAHYMERKVKHMVSLVLKHQLLIVARSRQRSPN